MKLKLKPGTLISRKSDSRICEVEYQEMHYCLPGCEKDHDCFTEPRVAVRIWYGTAIPISDISHVFDRPFHGIPNSLGRDFTKEDYSG